MNDPNCPYRPLAGSLLDVLYRVRIYAHPRSHPDVAREIDRAIARAESAGLHETAFEPGSVDAKGLYNLHLWHAASVKSDACTNGEAR